MRTRINGRHEEAARVRRTLRAAAVGRLLMGEFQDWLDFLEPDVQDYAAMPRRQLKALDEAASRQMANEVRKFCEANFEGMTIDALNRLYDAVKGRSGIELPRPAFEREYANIRQRVVKGSPRHATVVISLWGLQFWFPEQQLANDLARALADAGAAMRSLAPHYRARHSEVLARRDDIDEAMQRRGCAARNGLLAAFNLLECHMNSLAWAFLRGGEVPPTLSDRQRSTLQDAYSTPLRDKLLKYPEITTGRPLAPETRDAIEKLLEVIKPFRDSLVHPSPFEAPERFGGYDKLRMVYRIDVDTLFLTGTTVMDVIDAIAVHVGDAETGKAGWTQRVRLALSENVMLPAPEWLR